METPKARRVMQKRVKMPGLKHNAEVINFLTDVEHLRKDSPGISPSSIRVPDTLIPNEGATNVFYKKWPTSNFVEPKRVTHSGDPNRALKHSVWNRIVSYEPEGLIRVVKTDGGHEVVLHSFNPDPHRYYAPVRKFRVDPETGKLT